MSGRTVDVVVVGAGPAGLTAATRLGRLGIGSVEVLEREPEPGGVPRHSFHTGFGPRDLHRVLSGPRYAARLTRAAERAGVTVRTAVTVAGFGSATDLETISPRGRELVRARAVLLATGARERPRAARLVPGDRPDGVLTTGQLQQAVNLRHQPIGSRAVVVGAEHVSFSAVQTLAHAGCRVVAMTTPLARHQTYPVLRAGARLRYRFPLATGTQVVRILGRERVEAVELRDPDGALRLVECDTVVFTGDWIPEHELARRGGLEIAPGSLGPAVDTALRTSRAGVFAAGNLVHPVEAADVAALSGRAVADMVAAFLQGGTWPSRRLAVDVEPPLRWIAPSRIVAGGPRPPRARFLLRSTEPARRGRLVVEQGDRRLTVAPAKGIVPSRPIHLSDGWMAAVDLAGPEVRISLR